MSQSTIARRKSSPCCIGCVVLLIIAVGFSAAVGIYMYRFAQKNVSLVQVAGKNDPDLAADPDVLFPETVGEFQRTSVMDTLENVPEMADVQTSSAHIAVYEDANTNSMTVIAVSTAETREQRERGIGLLTMGRGKANAFDTGISIRDPFSGDVPRTIVTWSKPNWTYMVQTTSSLASSFVEDFSPGLAVEDGTSADRVSTATAEMAPSTETQYN